MKFKTPTNGHRSLEGAMSRKYAQNGLYVSFKAAYNNPQLCWLLTKITAKSKGTLFRQTPRFPLYAPMQWKRRSLLKNRSHI